METLNTKPKTGWLNRHTDPLPKEECAILILIESKGNIFECNWYPVETFTELPSKSEYYQGTARTTTSINNVAKGIGFHAWSNNDYEFVYYRLLLKATI